MFDPVQHTGLSLGCGLVYQAPDVWHVDCRHTPVTDQCYDLEQRPWPWPTNHFQRVIAHDIVEHLTDAIATMEEIWRVLRPQGIVYVRGPRYDHPQAYRALDHKHFFALDSMDLFVRGTVYHQGYAYYTHARFAKLDCQYAGAEIVWTLSKEPTDAGDWEPPHGD